MPVSGCAFKRMQKRVTIRRAPVAPMGMAERAGPPIDVQFLTGDARVATAAAIAYHRKGLVDTRTGGRRRRSSRTLSKSGDKAGIGAVVEPCGSDVGGWP